MGQQAYVKQIISHFGLLDARVATTPIEIGINLSFDSPQVSSISLTPTKKTKYRKTIGCLMYATVMTCPDITFAVSTLSQYLKAPHTTLLHAVTRVFRYLSGTKEYKFVLGGTDTSIFGDADSDYASQIHPHSISAFFISKGVVSWSSKKQPIRLNMSLLHMPQKISSGFKKFSKISHLYFLIPLQKISTVTTKARSVYPRTQLFTVTPNILMFIFILFGKQFFNVISLYSIVLWMI